MKKLKLITLILCFALLLSSCQNIQKENISSPDSQKDIQDTRQDADKTKEQNTEESSEVNNSTEDANLVIMVDNRLFVGTGVEDDVPRKCKTPDGMIDSSVEPNQIPTKNNQSNFGIGFEYQYSEKNTVVVKIDDKWIIFIHDPDNK